MNIHSYFRASSAARLFAAILMLGMVATSFPVGAFAADPPVTHTITASVDANGSISPSGSVSVNDGSDQTFTFAPDSGYQVDQVLVDGAPASSTSSPYTFSGVTGDHTIAVSFSAVTPPTTHTITASAGSNGSISPTGSVTVNDGDSQAFTFTPDSGYEVDTVSVDGSDAAATSSPYTFSDVTGDHTINVSFKAVSSGTGSSGNGPFLTVDDATAVSGDPINLTAHFGRPFAGIPVSFKVNGATVGATTTDSSGIAEIMYTPSPAINAGTYTDAITATVKASDLLGFLGNSGIGNFIQTILDAVIDAIFGGISDSADLIITSAGSSTPTYTVCAVDGKYTTIQAAVDAATSGDTITVCAGTYPEDVTVSQPLTIDGANAGVAGDATRGAESILDGSFSVKASNVTINGFTIDATSGSNPSSVAMQGAYSGEKVTNNIINDNGYAVNFNTADTVISNNKIIYGASFLTGVEANSNPGNGLTFDSNVFTGDGSASPADITVIGNKTSQTSNVTVTGNKSTSGTTLISLFNTDTAEVKDNTASGASVSSLVYVGGNDSNVTVTDNKLTSSGTGVNVANDFSDGANSSVTISGNDLSNNTAGVKVGTTAYTAATAVEATGNWWGDASGPTDNTAGDGSIPDTNPSGTGSPAVGAVHYADFCTDAVCTTNGGGTPSAPTLSITAPAADGDTASGTYDFTADYENGVTSSLQWAVRTDANCNTGTVAGNVDGHTDASTLSGADFSANLDTTAWANGNYCFVVNDGHHNRVERHFVVDNASAPVITSVTPASGSYIRGTVTFTVDASSTQPSYIYVELNKGGTWITDDTKSGHEGASEGTLTYDTTKLADGTYTLKVDAVGNGKTTEENYTYYVDNTKPTVAFTAPTPADGTYVNANFDVGYTASDNAMLKSVGVSLFDTDSSHSNHWVATCYNNGAEASTTDSGTCTVKLPAGIPDGEYYVQVGAQDMALNWSVNARRTIYVEREAPAAPTNLTAKFQYDAANIANGATLNKTASTTGNNLELLWTAPWGNITAYHILVTWPDGTQHTMYQGSNPYTWLSKNQYNNGDEFGLHGNGKYEFQVVAVNANGTSAPSATFTLYYDTQSPKAQFDPTPAIHVTGDFTVSGTASDNVALKGVIFDVRDPSITSGNSWVAGCVTGSQTTTWGVGSTTASTSCTINTANLVEGHTYTLRIHAGDYAGYGGGAQQDLIVDAAGNPTNPSTPTPTTVVVTSADTNGWTGDSASGAGTGFLADDDAPLGTGGLELTTSSDVNSVAHFTSTQNIPLSDLSTISYDTKQVSAADVANGNATLRINVDLDGDGTMDDQLMYEPYYNGFDGNTMTGWQTWDISSTTGKFWSNYTKSYNGLGGVGAGSYASNFSLADVLHDHPDAKITGVVLSMGTYNVSQDVLVDSLHIVSTTSDTTYDFEPADTGSVTPQAVIKSDGNRHNGGGGGLAFLGRVLGVSTTTVPQGQVLGASCGPTLSSYLWRGNANPADQVTILQNFLNTEMGSALPVTGFFGPLTEAAVKAFQLKYYADILGPWVAYGLPSDHTATGRVYKTTEWKINSLSCPETSSTTLPQLP